MERSFCFWLSGKCIRMNPKQNILVAVDAVVFGYNRDEGISILLIQRKYPPFKDSWAIPGGFVLDNESLEDAVHRELSEETGIEVRYLEQLYTFGDPIRDPRSRVISVSYYALVKSSQFRKLHAATDAREAKWFNFEKLPGLGFDHKEILEKAIGKLRSKITREPVGFELLDKKFTFAELEHLYSSLLDKRIDRRNFRKKILSLNILDELEEFTKPEKSGRPARLYRFNQRNYKKLLKNGIHFEI